MSAVAIADKFATQREHLARKLATAEAERERTEHALAEATYAGLEEPGTSPEAQALSRQVLELDTRIRALRTAAGSIDAAETAELAAAARARAQDLAKQLDKTLAAELKDRVRIADLVEALGAAVAGAGKREAAAKTLGDQLGLDVPGALHTMVTRALAEQGLRLVELTVWDIGGPTNTVSGATARLRARREPTPVRSVAAR